MGQIIKIPHSTAPTITPKAEPKSSFWNNQLFGFLKKKEKEPIAKHMKMVKVRFNNKHEGKLFWRVIVDGEETLADAVLFRVGTFTTMDKMPTGETKAHISAYFTEFQWIGDMLIIK